MATEDPQKLRPWGVVLLPVGDNTADDNPEGDDEKNVGGIRVCITDGDAEPVELSRVAFIRRNGKNTKRGFDTQLKMEVDKAEKAVTRVNATQDELDAQIADYRTRMDNIEEEFDKRRQEVANKAKAEVEKIVRESPAEVV